jgi:hypothetical protein
LKFHVPFGCAAYWFLCGYLFFFFCFSIQIGKSFVVSKLKDYPQFRSVSIAIQKSGFKVSIVNISSQETTLSKV